jgi:hypothetical protein
MSLLITRQRNKVLSDKPYSYRNDISNGFLVKANSEIALVSSVINRGGIFIIDDQELGGRYLGLFIGNALPDHNEIKYSNPPNDKVLPSAITVTKDICMSVLVPNGVYTNLEFIDAIVFACNDQCSHPILKDKITGSLKLSADDEFNGFKFNFEQNMMGTTAVYPDADGIFIENTYGNASYVSGVVTTSSTDADWNTAIEWNRPIHQAGGTFKFDLSDGDEMWAIGLTRNTKTMTQLPQIGSPLANAYTGSGIKELMASWFASDLEDFFDYVLCCDGTDIFLFSLKWTADIECEMMEIEYWEAASGGSSYFSVQAKSTDYAKPTIEFILNYESVDIFITEYAGVRRELSSEQLPAIGSCQYCLYPKAYLYGKSNTMTITKADYHATWDWTNDMYYTLWGKEDFVYAPGSNKMSLADQWCSEYLEDKILAMTQDTDEIPAGLWITGRRTGVSSSGANKYITMTDPEQLTVIVPGDSTVDYYLFKGNIAGFLGFDRIEDQPDSIAVDLVKYQTRVTKTPSVFSHNNIYVRINNLAMRTLNGETSSISRIVGSVPRTSKSSGSSTGIMFHEADNLIFLDLENDRDIMLNHIEVDFVNINETYALDLDDFSTAIFLIRKKRI